MKTHEAGFSGIAAITAGVDVGMICGRSHDGERCAVTLRNSGSIARGATFRAGGVSARRCCIGRTTREEYDEHRFTSDAGERACRFGIQHGVSERSVSDDQVFPPRVPKS